MAISSKAIARHAVFATLTLGAAAGCRTEKSAAGSTARASAAQSESPAPYASREADSVDIASVRDDCSSICERSRVLRCQNADECMQNCLGSAIGTPCTAEFLAFYQCLLPQPIKNWECAEDGVAAIREGFCDQEQEHAVRCMEAKAHR
jgi:hypothetical protein